CGTRLGPAFKGRARSPKDRQPIVDERFGSRRRRRQAVLTRRALPDLAEPYLSRIRIAGNKAASSRSLTSAAGRLRLPLPKTRGIERAPQDHCPTGDRRKKRLLSRLRAECLEFVSRLIKQEPE